MSPWRATGYEFLRFHIRRPASSPVVQRTALVPLPSINHWMCGDLLWVEGLAENDPGESLPSRVPPKRMRQGTGIKGMTEPGGLRRSGCISQPTGPLCRVPGSGHATTCTAAYARPRRARHMVMSHPSFVARLAASPRVRVSGLALPPQASAETAIPQAAYARRTAGQRATVKFTRLTPEEKDSLTWVRPRFYRLRLRTGPRLRPETTSVSERPAVSSDRKRHDRELRARQERSPPPYKT